jgi:GST-like protein
MIELHYWPTPNGHKVTLLLEELAELGRPLAYRIVPVDIGKGAQFAPAFLAISPNNKMPVIIDPDGPGGRPISVFESGAILQYLGRKTGKLYPADERRRVEVEQWLFWQVGGLGPMAGQAHHFRNYAPEKIPYGIDRYTKEVNRLYGVLDARLEDSDYVADKYSIADIAIYPWARVWKNQGQDIAQFPNVAAWLERIGARKAVQRGLALGKAEAARTNLATDKEAQKVLFGQMARPRKA